MKLNESTSDLIYTDQEVNVFVIQDLCYCNTRT